MRLCRPQEGCQNLVSPLPAGANDGDNIMPQFLDINGRNAVGATPLELSASQGHLKVVRYANIYTVNISLALVTLLTHTQTFTLTPPTLCNTGNNMDSIRHKTFDTRSCHIPVHYGVFRAQGMILCDLCFLVHEALHLTLNIFF